MLPVTSTDGRMVADSGRLYIQGSDRHSGDDRAGDKGIHYDC